jgi:hypothetical protein
VGGGFLVYNEFLASPTAVAPPAVPTIAGEATVDLNPPSDENETTPDGSTPTTGINPTVTLQGGGGVPAPSTGSNVDAVQLTSPPTIDGNLGDWGGQLSYVSAFRVFNAPGWNGTEDLTAVWQLGWDSNNLYIAVDVTDDTHVQIEDGNQIFRGDSVDIQFDTDRQGDFGAELSPDDIQITFSPGDFATMPPSAFRFQGRPNGDILDAPGGHQVIIGAVKTATGYTLEASIPWSNLNLTPQAGLVIGIALNASDNDTPGTAVQEVMMSHVSTRTLTDPRGWGTLTLK